MNRMMGSKIRFKGYNDEWNKISLHPSNREIRCINRVVSFYNPPISEN